MMKPTSKGRSTVTKRMEEGVLVKNPNKQPPSTPTRQLSARRKTSDEIANTVNGFIKEARASSKSAINKADPLKLNQNTTIPNRLDVTKSEILQKLIKGQKVPVKLAHSNNATSASKNASSTTTISFEKNAPKVAEKPLSKSRPELRPPPENDQPPMNQANRKKLYLSNAGVGTRKQQSTSAMTAVKTEGKSLRRSSGSAMKLQNDQIGNENHGSKPKLPMQKLRPEKPGAPNYSPNFYLTSSSSEDEEFRGPSRNASCEAPTSPASKAKMWNEIHKSPGPEFPGWKFRQPAQGRRMSQIGVEELTETFKNLDIEAERASKKIQDEKPRQNKFSNYMRKMKSASKSRDADTTTTGLESNINLKKMYSDQLDAMREKALASIKAMDARTRGSDIGSDGEISLEVVKDGVSRTYRGMTSADMLKSAVESLQQHRKESFNSQKPESGTYLDRKAGYEFAQGDRLRQEGTNKDKSAAAKNNTALGLGASAGERDHIIKGDQMKTMKRDANESQEAQLQDAARMKAFKDNPLQKLKKISETLKMERENALSRRALNSYFSSSSESDYESDGIRNRIK